MTDLPVVGAQLSVLDIDKNRDWLFEKNRDIELPEFSMTSILRSPEPIIDMARQSLDGWDGRLGIHGPYSGFELDTSDAEMRNLVQSRLAQALDICEALGAVQMVLHSPFDLWDLHNLGNRPNGLERRVEAILETMGPAMRRAESAGVTFVLENVKDVDPGHRRAVIEAAGSAALKLSVDTGHANWAYHMAGAPPADRFVSEAGAELAHVHLQDTDGYADRHWAIGQGNIPWEAVFEAIAGTKANPHLIVEIRDFDRVQESVAHLEAMGIAQ